MGTLQFNVTARPDARRRGACAGVNVDVRAGRALYPQAFLPVAQTFVSVRGETLVRRGFSHRATFAG